MLESSVRNGTSKNAEVKDTSGNLIDQGGKTGTTNENRTVWFAGITPKYATAVYIGYDDNRPIEGNITGGSGAAPIWGDFYQKLINKGLYIPEKFEFIQDNIQNGALIQQNLNSKNGLIATNGGREFLIKSGQISLEQDNKFRNGISGIMKAPEGANLGKIEELDEQQDQDTGSLVDRLLGN